MQGSLTQGSLFTLELVLGILSLSAAAPGCSSEAAERPATEAPAIEPPAIGEPAADAGGAGDGASSGGAEHDAGGAGDHTCAADADCDDGNPCNGEERCGPGGVCEAGAPVLCPQGEICDPPSAGCVVACEMPDSQLLPTLVAGVELTFPNAAGRAVEAGLAPELPARVPDPWGETERVPLGAELGYGLHKVFARFAAERCEVDWPFEQVYDVRPRHSPAAGVEGALAVALDDPRIVGWAAGFLDPVEYGPKVEEAWKAPERALGAAAGTAVDVVSLGDGGRIVLTFDPPIADGPGPDLAVFSNAFSDTFLELAYVEVSSDGEHFVRFDSSYVGTEPIGSFGTSDPTWMEGLAGKHRQGFGTTFDLQLLRYRPLVQQGAVDLQSIAYLRIVDVVGDGSASDSFGRPIYDPHPTTEGGAGFDLDGVAALHVRGGTD